MNCADVVAQEMKALGCLLFEGEHQSQMLSFLDAKDFLQPDHRDIYAAIRKVSDGGSALDVDSVGAALNGSLERVGGLDYLMSCMEEAVGKSNALWHAQRVKELSARRKVEDAAAWLRKKAGEGMSLEEIAGYADRIGRIARSARYESEGLSTDGFEGVFSPVSMSFLLEPYLPQGKCVLLDADGGTGKSSLMLAFAAAFSQGVEPITGRATEPKTTLYLHKGEDQSRELETVYRANGGRPGGIAYYSKPLVLDDRGVSEIAATVRRMGASLVVFDALFYFLLGIVEDSGNALDVLAVMERLNRMAEQTGCTVVSIRHTTKGTVGRKANELGMGSVQFKNSHRGQLLMRYHPGVKGLVVVTDEKGSILVPRGDAFAFRRAGEFGEIQFVRNFENPFGDEGQAKRPAKPGIATAKALIIEVLGSGGTIGATMLQAKADELGVSERTLNIARKELGVQAFRSGASSPWLLRLPMGFDPYEEP